MEFISIEFFGMIGGLFRLCELLIEALVQWLEEQGGKKNGRNNASKANPA